jgi:creatinine amidohydrolase
VLPIGSTEQHAWLSLATDNILAERVAIEAAAPLGVPVFPVLAYGITPIFTAYPGTVTLSADTHARVVREVLESLRDSGFHRILVVNGHGGNAPTQLAVAEWGRTHPDTQVRFHNWWKAPRTMERVREIDPLASHASWMENYPWTRIDGVRFPEEQKPMVDFARLATLDPPGARALLGDGNFGGLHARPDDDVLSVWAVAVEETRDLLTGDWT